jgi:hypothetical protein
MRSGTELAPIGCVLSRWKYAAEGRRDLRIDWLRGLAMTCVIINHSRMSSILSWFSYERFWVVTAAEVFVVLSGVVLGAVYGRRLIRESWRAVARGLGHRVLTLYVAFVAVTVSVLMLSLAGVDVQLLAAPGGSSTELMWFLDPRAMDAAAWRGVALMHWGPWAFEIIALYVWLVAAAVPALVVLHFVGWRPLLAVSWTLYLWYRVAPHALTPAEFETTFPVLAWQLLFVHGLVIGYHRERIGHFVAGCPRLVPILIGAATAAFAVFALCNPWMSGPAWLHWTVVSSERFTYLYFQYFKLADLGVGRLLNLAVALPVAYALLTRFWAVMRTVGSVFVTLGQQSLGAFVLHVYGILLIANTPLGKLNGLWGSTLVQILLIVVIAALLNAIQRLPIRRPRVATTASARPLAA